MKLIQEYIAYLKDNPQGYWFKRKLYGWGWTPAKLQGWAVVLMYLVGIGYFASRLEEGASFVEVKQGLIAPLIIMTLLFLFVTYLKGEKPKWQWGKRLD